MKRKPDENGRLELINRISAVKQAILSARNDSSRTPQQFIYDINNGTVRICDARGFPTRELLQGFSIDTYGFWRAPKRCFPIDASQEAFAAVESQDVSSVDVSQGDYLQCEVAVATFRHGDRLKIRHHWEDGIRKDCAIFLFDEIAEILQSEWMKEYLNLKPEKSPVNQKAGNGSRVAGF